MTHAIIDAPKARPRRSLTGWINQLRDRHRAACREAEIRDHHEGLDRAAGWLLGDYERAVRDGADRRKLAVILTGLSGCLLAQSACRHAQGDTVNARRDRLSGLLIQEVAWCAGDDTCGPSGYRGVRNFEFITTKDLSRAFLWLALAYRGLGHLADPDDDEFVVWGCLSELIEQVQDITPGTWPGPEILADMCDAHFAVESAGVR